MPGWNFADVWETVAEQIPDAQCQVQGDAPRHVGRVRPPGQRRRPHPARPGAPTSRTRSPSTSTTAPSTSSRCSPPFKAGLAPINTNYRYADDELVYLWDNADCVAVVFHGTFADRIERIRDRVPEVTTWLWVDDGDRALPRLGHRPTRTPPRPAPSGSCGPWGRDGDHLLMLYTGGTTGMPKGVMWRQDDLFRNLVGAAEPRRSATTTADLDSSAPRVTGARARRPARLPAHARHRLLHPADLLLTAAARR